MTVDAAPVGPTIPCGPVGPVAPSGPVGPAIPVPSGIAFTIAGES
jgi:hypothetical protein